MLPPSQEVVPVPLQPKKKTISFTITVDRNTTRHHNRLSFLYERNYLSKISVIIIKSILKHIIEDISDYNKEVISIDSMRYLE